VKKNIYTSHRRLASALVTCCVLAAMLGGCASQRAFHEGERLIAGGQPEAGLEKFREALSAEPTNAAYRAAFISTRDRLIEAELLRAQSLLRDDPESALRHYQRVLTVAPGNAIAADGVRVIERKRGHELLLTEARNFAASDPQQARRRLSRILREDPRHVEANRLMAELPDVLGVDDKILADTYRKPVHIELRDVNLKQLFDAISQASGLSFVFDKDIKLDAKTSLLLKDSTVEAALYYVLLTNQLEQQVMNSHTLLVYPNTSAKQKDYQQTVVRSFQLQNASAKVVADSVRTLLKLKDIVVDEKLNLLIVRESAEMVRLAERVIAAQDIAQSEVMLEVEVLEVSRDRLLELGVQLPGTASLAPIGSGANSGVTLADLRSLTGGTTSVAVDPLRLSARAVDTDANILANPRIRVVNNEKARITVGNKVPSFTSSVIASTTPVTSEAVTYIDVGLKLDVEPTIYANGEVAIRLTLEVTNIVDKLVSKGGTVAYTIGNRSAQTVLRLKDGENQVLAGLISDEDRRTLNKLPGIGDLPLLGRLFGSQLENRKKSEIVLSITPRLMRPAAQPDADVAEFDSGSENNLRRPPVRVVVPAQKGSEQ